jgi:N-acetylated-alpha-linked acidic dipeptidase
MDVAVSGASFGASSVPSLKRFLSDVTKAVPSPKGGTVYDAWKKANQPGAQSGGPTDAIGDIKRTPAAQGKLDVPVGDLGSGSDYTVFLQHLGVPATDITSNGPYGVYHSAFDNFNWFKRFADPDFLYEQEMARVFGIEVLRMADADVLPYDYEEYGKEVTAYVETARKKADTEFGANQVIFLDAVQAARRFEQAGARILGKQENSAGDSRKLNQTLLAAEHGLLIAEGLPTRPWFHHAIYAPGRYTGYAAVVIPGINEAIERHDLEQVRQQIAVLAAALDRAAGELEGRR